MERKIENDYSILTLVVPMMKIGKVWIISVRKKLRSSDTLYLHIKIIRERISLILETRSNF